MSDSIRTFWDTGTRDTICLLMWSRNIPEVRLAAGIRVFVMEDGDTRLAAKLPAAGFKNFLFFPLPTDDTEYRDYMDALRARFPKGALRTVIAGGHEFSFGAMSDLCAALPDGGQRRVLREGHRRRSCPRQVTPISLRNLQPIDFRSSPVELEKDHQMLYQSRDDVRRIQCESPLRPRFWLLKPEPALIALACAFCWPCAGERVFAFAAALLWRFGAPDSRRLFLRSD